MATNIKTVMTYPLNGSTTDFNIPFEYLARKFVQVTLIGIDRKVLVLNQDYRFATKSLISTTRAWGIADAYQLIEIRRYTSATERLVDFTDGSILRAYDLNISQVQTLHVAEEARDSALLVLPEDDAGSLDARNRKIVRLAHGVNDADAVNKFQLDTAVGAAGGILSDVKKVQQETYDYIEKFADMGLPGSRVALEQGGSVQDALRYLTISATGSADTDDAMKNSAIAKCELLGIDLVINPGNYKFTTPLVWNAKRYSIRGTGNAVIDFTELPVGSYAITIKPEPTSAGTIWNASTHSLSGLIFKGAPGIHGIKISQEINFDSPQITVRDCLFNEFDDHATFGDNEWCCSFERVNFRANKNGSSRFVVVNKAYNGCENQRFLGCNFNGSNSGLGIKHIAGSCEFTFDGCSFDYCHQVLSSVNAGARGIWRFNDSHFEDDGTKRQFDINSRSATFYVDFNQCDWAFITKDSSGNNRIPTSFGTFESTNQTSTLRVIGCKFPIYDMAVDRTKSHLWVINNSPVRILASGNAIEHANNTYFNMFSFGLNKFLALTDANRSSPALGTNGLGSITYDTSDLPENRINDNTWCITGVISGNVMIPIDPSNREINLSGNLKRTSGEYYIDVRFFTALHVQLSTMSLGIPGDINTWVHFGQTVRAPAGAAFIRVGWAYSAPPSTTDTLRLNSICVEHY